MIALATVIHTFESQLRKSYGEHLLPSQLRALGAMKRCRTAASRHLQAQCIECSHSTLIPHSCGHRLCPHYQNFESQRWLERQQQRRVPAEYFLLTFTVPRQLRRLAYANQRIVYDALMKSAWETVKAFAGNDKKLCGTPGAIAVLHTNTRRLDYHPHVHLVVPAATINYKDKRWRSRAKQDYLFNHKALAKVFRGKLLSRLTEEQLIQPKETPKKWVVDCKSAGTADDAIIYLGRYHYWGVVREKDIINDNSTITYCYTENTGRVRFRTKDDAKFLWMLLKHILPRGFRRSRNYGFLHHNSKTLIQLVQLILLRTGLITAPPKSARPEIHCKKCGGVMRLVAIGIEATGKDTEPRQLRQYPVMYG